MECRTLEEGHEAATAGADIVMLDNMDPQTLKLSASLLKSSFPHLVIEGSGGITLSTMHEYFSPHVDVISMGKLTQGYDCLDFSLKIARGLGAAAASSSSSAAKKRKKGGARKGSDVERVAVPGAYRCIKEPAIAFRLSTNLDDRDELISPVEVGARIDGCAEVAAADGGAASWLRVDHAAGGPRFLPTFIDGEALFEPVGGPLRTLRLGLVEAHLQQRSTN